MGMIDSSWMKIGAFLGPGMVFDTPDDEVWITEVNGALLGISNICTHKLGPLNEGGQRNGSVECPWHGYVFDLSSGVCTSHKCANLRRYQVAVQDGILYLKERMRGENI